MKEYYFYSNRGLQLVGNERMIKQLDEEQLVTGKRIHTYIRGIVFTVSEITGDNKVMLLMNY